MSGSYVHWKLLNKTDTSFYKGISILLIVTHNFMNLFPTPKHNEFGFNQDRFFSVFHLLMSEPENSIQYLLSFFGHFGVQVFIFLSAYGLTKKYLSSSPKYWSFIIDRFQKIYPSFILAILFWLTIVGFNYGALGPLKLLYWNFENLILKLTLLSNFFPDATFKPIGPWWFIPFIFQFYFAFPLLIKLYLKHASKALIVLSVISIIILILFHGKINGINLSSTLLGHLPEFCLGIYLAKNDQKNIKIYTPLLFFFLAIYLLGNIYETLWYISSFSFLIILLAVIQFFNTKSSGSKTIKKVILFFGSISMPLFLVNAFLRHPFILWAKEYNQWFLTIIFCLMSLAASVIVAIALSKTERYLMSKWTRH